MRAASPLVVRRRTACVHGAGALLLHIFRGAVLYPVVFMYGAGMSTVVVLDNREVSPLKMTHRVELLL